jgi:hypothetical protein
VGRQNSGASITDSETFAAAGMALRTFLSD